MKIYNTVTAEQYWLNGNWPLVPSLSSKRRPSLVTSTRSSPASSPQLFCICSSMSVTRAFLSVSSMYVWLSGLKWGFPEGPLSIIAYTIFRFTEGVLLPFLDDTTDLKIGGTGPDGRYGVEERVIVEGWLDAPAPGVTAGKKSGPSTVMVEKATPSCADRPKSSLIGTKTKPSDSLRKKTWLASTCYKKGRGLLMMVYMSSVWANSDLEYSLQGSWCDLRHIHVVFKASSFKCSYCTHSKLVQYKVTAAGKTKTKDSIFIVMLEPHPHTTWVLKLHHASLSGDSFILQVNSMFFTVLQLKMRL